MNLFRTFSKLNLADKFAPAAAAVTATGGLVYLITFIASTDTVQKCHIKHKLLSMKFSKPPHMNRVKLIT